MGTFKEEVFKMPEIKLVYFDLYGRGEIIRIILHYAGVDFIDHRIKNPFVDNSEWLKIKPTIPSGQVPALYWDGKLLSQSLSISRFLAKQFNLAGINNMESAMIDEMVDQVLEINEEWYAMTFEPDEDKKKEKKTKFYEKTLPLKLGMIEKRMDASGGQFLAANRLSWADLYFFQSMKTLFMTEPKILDPFSKLDCLMERVGNLPNIKKYISERPEHTI